MDQQPAGRGMRGRGAARRGAGRGQQQFPQPTPQQGPPPVWGGAPRAAQPPRPGTGPLPGQAPVPGQGPLPGQGRMPGQGPIPRGGRGEPAAEPRGQIRQQSVQPSVAQAMAGLTVSGGAGAPSSGDARAGGAGRGVPVEKGNGRGGRRKDVELTHTRPEHITSKTGTSGTSITLNSNYFPLLHHTKWALYQYHVDFQPEEDRTGVKKKMMHLLTKELKGFIFDGAGLYLTHKLPKDPQEYFVKHPVTEEKTRIIVKFARDLSHGDIQYIQVFNIIIRRCLGHLKLQLIQRDYFDPAAKIIIDKFKMELWPGYVTSIKQHETKVMLGVEIAHKVMRRDTAYDVLRDIMSSAGDSEKQRLFQESIMGTVVLTDINNRTYRVSDVDWDQTPSSRFRLRDGREITYAEYYKDKYNYKVRDLKQPMLVSRAKPREVRSGMAEVIYLIPELCRMTGLTDRMRSDFQMMKAIAEYTRVTPATRVEKLNRFIKRMYSVPEVIEDLKQWDLKLSNQLIELKGRVLSKELIYQGNQRKYPTDDNADWTRNLRSNPMLTIGTCDEWLVVCDPRDKDGTKTFIENLLQAAASMNFRLKFPKLELVQGGDRIANIFAALEAGISKYRPHLVFYVSPSNKADRYSAVKKKLCIDHAIPSQVFLSRTLQNRNLGSVAMKVAIQMNCKVGGAPWAVNLPFAAKFMIIGYDVCHDTTDKRKSFGATVASLNDKCSRYMSSVDQHFNGEELSNHFALNIIKSLRAFYSCNNNTYPEYIIIYRDGVGDGQLDYVLEHELKMIIAELNKFYPKGVKLAFIVVTKRIMTRFFARTQTGNPPPGTVVDTEVTLPERYDFFLIAQAVRQGTVTPTNYNIIYDTTNFEPEKMQAMTYKLCHSYFNWSGTVRVPAPVQYAHKLAFLVANAIHMEPRPELQTLLYYL